MADCGITVTKTQTANWSATEGFADPPTTQTPSLSFTSVSVAIAADHSGVLNFARRCVVTARWPFSVQIEFD